MKRRNVSMDVKRGLRNSIILPTLTYGSENWTWNGAHQSRVWAVEMSYQRGACGVSRWDGLNNECVRCGVLVGWSVAWWNGWKGAPNWFGHIERMGNEKYVKVYLSSVESTNRRGRPLGRWVDRMWKYASQRGVRGNVLEWVRNECMDRERWRSVCHGNPLGGVSASELLIDWSDLWQWLLWFIILQDASA